nr:coproporphyrinogen dehydrogenase HemZ [Tissierella sp.]
MIKIINIYIEGHKYSRDLFELARAFLGNQQVKIIENIDTIGDKEYLIESRLEVTGNQCLSVTTLYRDNNMLEQLKENINDIKIDLFDRVRLQKHSIKKGIYNILSSLLNKQLPWGILTGIRPVKVVHELIDAKLSSDEVLKILKNEYRFMEEKAQLILDVALSQRQYIYPRDGKRFSLYINIPFCPSKCSYCSFPSFKIGMDSKIVEDYIQALLFEIEETKEMFKDKKLNTVYIGGGTPTSLKSNQLERIIKKIKEIFPDRIKEFTVEAGRPDTINREKLEMLKRYGVTRISINPQTFNEKTLKIIGRDHGIKSIKTAYNLAKSLDFDIINMDIILGLPGEGIYELEETLNGLKSLNPENLTVHTLSIKKGSRLHQSTDTDVNWEIEKMLHRTILYSKSQSYSPYYLYRQKKILGNLENIGYTKAGKECLYNIAMMEEKETIFAFGLGAVTKIYYPAEDKILRIANFKSLHDYIDRISELVHKKKDINFNLYKN